MAIFLFKEGKKNISYQLILSNRKSLEIAVHPNKNIIVKAPKIVLVDDIKKRVRKRILWIQKQIRYFEQFEPRTPKRLYIGGESHLYLGKSYRLKIEKSPLKKVALKNGYFYIATTGKKPELVKSLLTDWYEKKAFEFFNKVFQECWERFNKTNLKKPKIKIKKMKTRWGSLSEKKIMTLNLDLIKTPRDCIEYVIIHELCHLIHCNHSPRFYNLLKKSMPDWLERKHKLELALA